MIKRSMKLHNMSKVKSVCGEYSSHSLHMCDQILTFRILTPSETLDGPGIAWHDAVLEAGPSEVLRMSGLRQSMRKRSKVT